MASRRRALARVVALALAAKPGDDVGLEPKDLSPLNSSIQTAYLTPYPFANIDCSSLNFRLV